MSDAAIVNSAMQSFILIEQEQSAVSRQQSARKRPLLSTCLRLKATF
jgi:hypothetical protein